MHNLKSCQPENGNLGLLFPYYRGRSGKCEQAKWGWTRGQGYKKSSESLSHMLLNEDHSPEFKGLNVNYIVTEQIQISKAL